MSADAIASNPAAHLAEHQFKPGECGARRRGKRFTELYSKAEAELGDDLSAVEAMLLESAINLFIKAERTHDVEQKVRATNAAARLFFALHKSHRKPAPPPPSLGELGL